MPTGTTSDFIRYKCNLRLITPTVAAGFDSGSAELHWAAIRGNVRRFHRLIDPGIATEARIFGGTTPKTGQSLWLLRSGEAALTSGADASQLAPKYFTWSVNKRGYFRPHEGATMPITFDIIFKPEALAPDRRRVRDAFRLWSLWGGIGARTRRGFGSVSLEMAGPPGEPAIAPLPADLDGWRAAVAGEVGSIAAHYGVTWQLRWIIGPPRPRWEEALTGVAASMAAFRGYPRNRPEGRQAPETVRFGLPVRLGIGTFSGEKHDRSASSVWVRVIRVGNRHCASVVYMPAPFLPPGEGVGGLGERWEVPSEDVLARFMDELAAAPGWREVVAHG